MSIARDISRQTGRQSVTLGSTQSNITVTGGFSGSTLEVYLNGAKLLEGEDYTLNGTTGIILSQAGVAGDVIEFVSRVTSNVGLTAVGTANIIDESVTFGKLSNSVTEADNVQKRTAKAWVNFNGFFGTSPFTEANGGIRSSFNITSVSDNGTGQYTINFTQPFSNTNYVSVGFARDPDDNSTIVNLASARLSRTKTINSFGVDCSYAGAFYNSPEVNFVFFA